MGRARQRQLDTFGDLLRARPGEPYATTLAHAWSSMTSSDGRPFLRMSSRLRESPAQQLWPDFRRAATTDWLQPLEDGLSSIGRPELATLVLAVIRGLLMDLDATADAPARTGPSTPSSTRSSVQLRLRVDGLPDDPPVLADETVPGEPELLVGRQRAR